MHGMFRANGGCGYVKKPDFLMKTGPGNEVFDPRQISHVKKTLKVNIFSRTEYHESAAIFFPFQTCLIMAFCMINR